MRSIPKKKLAKRAYKDTTFKSRCQVQIRYLAVKNS